jgi:hypothetical protein
MQTLIIAETGPLLTLANAGQLRLLTDRQTRFGVTVEVLEQLAHGTSFANTVASAFIEEQMECGAIIKVESWVVDDASIDAFFTEALVADGSELRDECKTMSQFLSEMRDRGMIVSVEEVLDGRAP